MKRLLVQWCWLVAVVVMGACFSPQFQDGQIACAPDDSCPPGFECVGGVCRTGNTIDGGGTTAALIVNLGGNGTGSVASSPGGIDCGSDCTEEYAIGTSVTLTATPSSGSVFVGWSGGCSGTSTCNVTLNTATTVTANFAVDNSLVVVLAGNGSGVVSSSPPGINCGGDCTEQFAPNTQVVLTASAGTGSTFEGWSGAGCTGTGTCAVTADTAKMVTATFTLSQHALNVSLDGNGSGTVASNPAGIDCGTDCSEAINYNTMVTLTATPTTGSTFTGWTGANCTGTGTCVVTMTAAASVTATFTLTSHAVTVMKAGNGDGTVTSSPTGINCGSGAGCTASFDYNTSVTLSATPAIGSTFTGWSGGGCSGTAACVVSVTAATTVTATFALNTYTLSVVKAGNGDGLVASNISGISCGSDCSQDYNYNTMVMLTATPSAGSTFDGWSGGVCSGTSMTCTVTLAAATSVTATFSLTTHALTVQKAGTGSGTVTGVGISCGSDCTETYDYGATVTLSASPSAGSSFDGWSGAGCSGTGTCVVSMTMARTVTAQFTLSTHLLTVSKQGNGGGTVTSDVNHPGVSCGTDCTELYDFGAIVTLTAAPQTGSTFAGWSGGGCTGSTSTCDVPISQATTVQATFTLTQHALTVVRAGGGTGTVTSLPSGVNCGTDCNETYNYNTVVTLTASASAGSIFTGWSNGVCSGTGTCEVTMTTARSVTATFIVGSQALTVTKAGNGTGTVTSNIAGINCGTDCSEDYANNTTVVLTATPTTGSTFTGWSGGGCTGAGTCTVNVTASPVTITATFTLSVHTVSVNKLGTGGGTVISDDSLINCGSDCGETYNYGTSVRLTATAAAGSVFAGWSGACSGTGTCAFTVTAASTVNATFNPITHALSITKSGRGDGTVVSTNPAGGINCGTDCTENYNQGTMVTLTATPATGSTFEGWSGGGCSGVGPCTTTMSQAQTVDAQFAPTTHTLTVVYSGPVKSGVVKADDASIDCTSDTASVCSNTYEYGTKLTLTATPEVGFSFVGWTGGGCTGNGTCDLLMTQATNVTATFAQITHTLTVNKAGNGAGSITSNVSGINCGSDCNEVYDYGTIVTLTAGPSAGSTFGGWTGACTNATGTCQVTMSQARSVTATFTLTTHLVSVSKTGTGTGTITSMPSGINCGSDCSESMNYDTVLQVSATPAAGSTFTNWATGPCAGSTATTCMTTVTSAVSMQARFTVIPPNKVFVTSTTYTGNLGGLTGADAKCAARAAAGNHTGTFRAYLSTSTTTAISRLNNKRGWVRVDGKPVVDQISDLSSSHMFYPIRIDELGNDVLDATVYTGDGAADHCNNWTDGTTASTGRAGYAMAVGSPFAGFTGSNCTIARRLYCFQVDNLAVVAPPVVSKRLAFTTEAGWNPSTGIASADALCMSEATDAGIASGATFKALLPTTTASPISRFNTTGLPWARRDNTLLAPTAASLADATRLFLDAPPSGNASNDQWYGNNGTWGGTTKLTAAGTVSTTCNNWSTTAGTATGGRTGFSEIAGLLANDVGNACTSATRRIICLQE